MPKDSYSEAYDYEDDESFEDDEATPPPRRRPMRMRASSNVALRRRALRVRGARNTRAGQLSPVRGSSVVMATLPNGRQARLRITPKPASAAAVNRLRTQIMASDKRQAKALAANATAIRKLGEAQAAAIKKISDQQAKSQQTIAKQIASIEKRVDKLNKMMLGKQQSALDKHRRAINRDIKRARKRALWNDLLIITSLPMFAAYGDSENPLSRDNLVLTGSLAGWLLADDLLDAAMGRTKKEKAMKSLGAGADVWNYLAPVGNAATVYLLMRNKQHERIINGMQSVTFTPTDLGDGTFSFTGTIPLTVAEGYQEEFNGRTDLSGVASFVSAPISADTGVNVEEVYLTAEVRGGALVLTLHGDIGFGGSGTPGNVTATIAWMVDTDSPNA